MNKGISKWPSKVLNLLVVLAMVISLSAILVAPSIAVADEECPRVQVYDGCHLSVAVSTYIKDADDNFIPWTSFDPPGVGELHGDCFYVNAVVVNDGNGTATAPINATISFPEGGVELGEGQAAYDLSLSGDNNSQIWPGTQGTADLLPGRIADFWWKVCCNKATDDTTIRVNVTADQPCASIYPAFGETEVTQAVTGDTKCIEVKIVEAPGLGPVTGRLINTDTGLPVVYDSGMPDTLQPCQNFGIKAEITNLCPDDPNGIDIGDVHIDWTGPATLVGIDPDQWPVGVLQYQKTAVVAWTLHCDGPGDVLVNVTAPDVTDITTYIPDLDQDNDAAQVIVHQETAGVLVVTITQPTCGNNTCNPECLIKEPSSSSCQNQQFDVQARLLYTGAGTLTDCYADLSASPSSGWVTVGTSNLLRWSGNLTGGLPKTVDFGNVSVVLGADAVGNLTVRLYSMATGAPPEATPAQVSVSVQQVIAEISPGSATPSTVNICDPAGFDVTYRFYNWSGIDWAKNNVIACIDWNVLGLGNVSLESVWWRKITSGVPAGTYYEIPLESTTLTEGQDCMSPTETICKCCSFDVKWHFICTGKGGVKFQGNVTVSQTSPPFTGSDKGPYVCVAQVWKAELWTDVAFFIQNDYRVMIEQDAMVPGNEFHVVIPVINTGDATATDVKVYFQIVDTPTSPCTQSYEVISDLPGYGGDATIVPLGGGAYVATFAHIAGQSTEKAVLLLHCLCEGQVSVIIPEHMPGSVPGWTPDDPGMKAFDANTPGVAVPIADIHVPPCPMVFQQVPFTVTIENPDTCQTFTAGDIFAVKALIHNGSIAQDFIGVNANLIVTDGTGTLIDLTSGTVRFLTPQNNPKDVGNISRDSDTEITWTLQCWDEGEVYISVSASSTTPMLTAFSNTIVNVHQIQPPEACLGVEILSPDEDQSDNPDNDGHPMIATGQQFAVTAKIMNWGSSPAENVVVTLYPHGCCLINDGPITSPGPTPVPTPAPTQGKYVTLAPGETGNRTYQTIGNRTFVVATFTLVGGGDSDWGLKDCSVRTAHICVNATTTTNDCDRTANDDVEVSIYPAAFLKATIDSIVPSSPITLGNQFTVNYTVTNYGVADAWNASVTLSADSKVSLAAGPGGYAQPLGTIPGWGWGDFNYVEGSFQLQCTAAGLSTLTLTPTGQDECGWQPVLGWKSYEEQVWKHGWVLKEDTNFQWVQLAGDPIYSWFIVPASETIAQSPSGGADLSITKTVDNASPSQSAVVHFTVTVTNNGPADATGILVSDIKPSGLTFGAATASQGSWSTPTWTVGSLVAGGSASLVIPATVTNAASPITNTASVTATQFDPNSTNNSASVILNSGKLTSMSVTFKHGSWTLFSMPLVPGNTTPEAVLSGLPTGTVVYRYDASTDPGAWSFCTLGVGGALTEITDGWGYWVYLGGTLDKTFNVTGTELPPVIAGSQPPVPPSYDVFVGWNLLGFKSTTAKAENVYLAGIANLYTKIYGYADGAYFTVMSGANLQPGSGYWIAVPGAVLGTKVGSIFP